MATIYMETTKISSNKTIGEIQTLLAGAGCSKVMIDYANGEPIAILFSINCGGKAYSYKLPARTGNILKYLQAKRGSPQEKRGADFEQSNRVGWRQILRWIQAQLALIKTGMVDIKEVFLPYAWDGEKTYYEIFAKAEGLLLIEDR